MDHHGGYGFAIDAYLLEDDDDALEDRYEVLRNLKIFPEVCCFATN